MTIEAAAREAAQAASNGIHKLTDKATSKPSSSSSSNKNIIDIRTDTEDFNLRDDISKGLNVPKGAEKRLPTMLLYDEEGLKLFEAITYLEEYYLTNAEIHLLQTNADRMAERIPNGAMVIELGSGNLRKVNILLQALEAQRKHIKYYALDLSLAELERTLADIPPNYTYVTCHGLWGTYDDGLKWIQTPANADKPKSILWLGSSVGNFTRDAAVGFLRSWADALTPRDTMLIAIDACKNGERVYHAYNDREGTTHRFILNGLLHANRLLGAEQFALDDWRVIGEYDNVAGRHHAFVSPVRDVVVDGVSIAKGERIRIEESYKWSAEETEALWKKTGLVEGAFWASAAGDYGLHMMTTQPPFTLPKAIADYAGGAVPTLSNWAELWAAWDTVTRDMIPDEELLQKPIKLRNACIFYLGHIPTFLDMHLARATDGTHCNEAYPRIFERGIDPDVENPELCHAHSEIPDSWPPLEEILDVQDQVRARVKGLYKSGKAETDTAVAKALWLGFEHELMHLETLLYMLVQSEKTKPPTGVVKPDFESLATKARRERVENEWVEIPGRNITVGTNELRDVKSQRGFFAWDNEYPPREVKVQAFVSKARPITNGEYAKYLIETGAKTVPASWSVEDASVSSKVNGVAQTNGEVDRHSNGTVANGATRPAANGVSAHSVDDLPSSYLKDKFVRTVFGPVLLQHALDWPILASYDEVAGCARWMGGRVPTADEVRSIYEYVDELKQSGLEKAISKTIPAVNGHLVNNGVEESPPSHTHSAACHASTIAALHKEPSAGHAVPDADASTKSTSSSLFTDLAGTNTGFAHWHPTPVSKQGGKLVGRSDFGGAWEWTSTVLEPHDGFEPMSLYPGYTADFFDGKHNVVLGGSWATHPRIAGRKSFVNWYQRNYPYVWAGARIVKDL